MPDALSLQVLRDENERLRLELVSIKQQLHASKQGRAGRQTQPCMATDCSADKPPTSIKWAGTGHNLSKAEIERYSRHLLLGSFGAKAQEKLCQASVLIVGAGGLGCPAAVYLAASGIGRIGIVDHDTVELSNLHRQILHTEASVGTHKAQSAASACCAVNSSIEVTAHEEGFLPSNALSIARRYDIVLDATDNAATRYLINDACCILGLPLVSGAAIGMEGQLAVYCHQNGPCYRCLFPQAPSPESCSRCSEAGVLGPVPGVIGTLQALEAIKIITGRFTSVKLRGKQKGCASCSSDATILESNLAEYSYPAFTEQAFDDRGTDEISLLNNDCRVDAASFLSMGAHIVQLDVRPPEQHAAFHLEGSVQLPYDERNPSKFEAAIGDLLQEERCPLKGSTPLVVLCRKGNDSQRVVQLLDDKFGVQAKDLQGGLLALAQHNDTLPSL